MLKKSTISLDQYFRAVFSFIDVARQLIKYSVPSHIVNQLDLSTLELTNETHIDENLKKSLTDLVYICKMKKGKKPPARICLLFEHKSYYPGRKIYPQIIRYLACTQENDIKQKNINFTVSVPIIFYHGEKKWKPKPIVSQYGSVPEDFKKYIPNFEFAVVNLAEMSREEILGMQQNIILRNIFLVLKRAWDDNFFREHFKEIIIFADETISEEVKFMLFDLTMYLIQQMSKFKKSEIMEITTQLPPKYKNRVKFTYEYFLEEGMEKAIKSFMLKFPQSTIEEVASIFNVSHDFIKKIKNSIESK
jgi:predicted transposase/invertase (TIGR01784 family)